MDWNTAANWMPATVPNSTSDTASFDASNVHDVSLSAPVTVSSIVFKPGAGAYTINHPTTTLTLTGAGIVNDSGVLQSFTGVQVFPNFPFVTFTNSASAGTLTSLSGQFAFLLSSSAGSANLNIFSYGPTSGFSNTATAADSTIFLNAGDIYRAGLYFIGSSTAGNAHITTSPDGVEGGSILFNDSATAGNATITVNGGNASAAVVTFYSQATAGNATLIATGGEGGTPGGQMLFEQMSTGGSARLEVFGNGLLDISVHGFGGLSIGSIEGDGNVFLGKFPLTLTGSLSTTFAGILQDGGIHGGTGGSVVKNGSSTLTLTGANTYTGATTVTAGALIVANSTGSATGAGPVLAQAGTLGGGGTVTGAVTIGTAGGSGAFLAPAATTGKSATFATQGLLTLLSDATYTYTFKAKGRQARADRVVANGVTITGAILQIQAQIKGLLAPGTTFTVINNTAATPISGTFANLSEGAIVTIAGNNFQVSYQGGDGNDLTLTVE